VEVTLTLTGKQHKLLREHLFCGDGCESVAILLCGRRSGSERHRLVVHEMIPIPNELCIVRRPDQVTWPTDMLPDLLNRAAERGMAFVKIHSHHGYDQFSETDDRSDRALFPSVYSWTGSDEPHVSAVMLETGRIFARVVDETGQFTELSHVNVVGDDLTVWPAKEAKSRSVDFGQRVAQTFGAATFQKLSALRIAVVGCSGTGSIVVEQLARNCVGSLVLVDPDRVENKNLNRILNSQVTDVGRLKVDVLADAIRDSGLGTHVETHAGDSFDPMIVEAVASCDVVFGCMDTVDGRHLLNKLATFYLIAYFDLGVKLEADGLGGIDQVCGTVHYLQPGGSSLLTRGVYNMGQVSSAGLKRTDPASYRDQLNLGYIRGVLEDRPAVIQLNMLIASLAVNELLARLHPYRIDPNADFAVHRISLSHGIYEHLNDGESCALLTRHVGRGDVMPRLDWSELSIKKAN
jgi:hypothetical protein